jgi:hypothetical protein
MAIICLIALPVSIGTLYCVRTGLEPDQYKIRFATSLGSVFLGLVPLSRFSQSYRNVFCYYLLTFCGYLGSTIYIIVDAHNTTDDVVPVALDVITSPLILVSLLVFAGIQLSKIRQAEHSYYFYDDKYVAA